MPINKKNVFVTDFSSSAIAEGKINIAMKEKKKLNYLAIINNKGNYSNNPNDLYNGGTIIPFGGHKGSAFSLVIELLSGISISQNLSFKKNYKDSNNCFLVIFKKKMLMDEKIINNQIKNFYKRIKDGKKIKKYKNKIYLPGEIEKEKYLYSRKYGINYNDNIIKDLNKLAQKKYNLNIKL